MKKQGFTIIELIVVIAIIAVLASIVMVNVMQYIQKSKIAAVKANINNIPLIITKQIVDGTLPYASCGDISNITNAIAQNGYSMTYPKGGCYSKGWVGCNSSSNSNPWCAFACNSDRSDCYCTDSTGAMVNNTGTFFDSSCYIGSNGCDCT